MDTQNTEGVELYVEVLGSGEPLVLLPVAGQSHVAYLENGLAARFAEHFRVVLMDLTGLGRSGRVTEVKPGQWAADVVSVLDALGIERAHLAGSSLGARVAARVAADHPDRVSTLLVDMPITSVDEQQEAALDDFFAHYATNVLAVPAQRYHGEQWREAMDFFVATRTDPAFREHYLPASYLDRVQAPTLVSRGDPESPVHPLAQALEWHARSRDSALWIEPGASDMALMRACPDRVVDMFVRFTASVAAREQVVS